MKRALVAYTTDSESEGESSAPPSKRLKQLPKLSASLTPPVPEDDPSKHQGRIRSQPFVDGQFATHIYIPIDDESLLQLLDSIIKDVQETCQDFQVFSLLREETDDDNEEKRELHLSISRPLYIRSHQRETVRRAVKDVAKQTIAFEGSFASFAILDNDEKTRSFLAVEIGAGHAELSKMSTSLNPLLEELRQPSYYSQPRYHVSLAWILTSTNSNSDPNSDATAVRFPNDLIDRLEERFGVELRAKRTDVKEVCTRIGKQVTRCKLG